MNNIECRQLFLKHSVKCNVSIMQLSSMYWINIGMQPCNYCSKPHVIILRRSTCKRHASYIRLGCLWAEGAIERRHKLRLISLGKIV